METSACHVVATTPLNATALDQIELYRRRFRELWANWESLRASGIGLGGSFENLGENRISGGGCGIENHRLKGLYLDFRVFWAQDEPTNYFTVSKLIGKHFPDPRVHKCLKENKQAWHRAGILHDWHGFTADKLTDVMFNAQLFHSATDLRAELDRLNNSMSSELAHHLLTLCVYERTLIIRNLNWIVEPLSHANQVIRLSAEYS